MTPLILISCLNFMGFSLHSLEAQLANNISLFLSALALLYVVGQDLPRTTFLTAIDRIVLVTLLLIFVTSIHFVGLWRRERGEQLQVELAQLGRNVTEDRRKEEIARLKTEMENMSLEHLTILTYFIGYIVYLALELMLLIIRRLKHCHDFRKNVDSNNVFLDGIEEHNNKVREDPNFEIPAWIFVDPYKICLVKHSDPRALILTELVGKPPGKALIKMFLVSGKAVVMSSKPEYKYAGKHVKWMTVGSAKRVIEIVIDNDNCVKVRSAVFYQSKSLFSYPSFQLVDSVNLVWDCVFGKYEPGTEVVFYEKHCGENQRFVANMNGTISPVRAPQVVLGMNATSLTHDAEKNDCLAED